MSGLNATMDVYLTGLRNQHAVETQAIGTIKNQLSRMEPYPALHTQMQHDMQRSETQAAGFAHVTSGDEVLKNVLAAIGYKAYEISSYKVLITLANLAGVSEDVAVLEQSMKEEQEMGDWLGSHLPDIVQAYLSHHTS